MTSESATRGKPLKSCSGVAPFLMSGAALTIVLLHIASVGVARESDEGAAAHMFQLLIAAQVPIIVYFAAVWLQRAPRQALSVMALQVLAMGLAWLPVFYLGL